MDDEALVGDIPGYSAASANAERENLAKVSSPNQVAPADRDAADVISTAA